MRVSIMQKENKLQNDEILLLKRDSENAIENLIIQHKSTKVLPYSLPLELIVTMTAELNVENLGTC